MHIYDKIYQFAASAGALEGFVYQKKNAQALGLDALSGWIDNIELAYDHLPESAKREFQDSCDRTIGRAIHSLVPVLGANHKLIEKLKMLVKGSMPASADDFNETKWFQR
jgi:hypothetical protein